MKSKLDVLIATINECKVCAEFFSHDPKPIFQLNKNASILIAGQAPGQKAHDSGVPFDDASGDRLRKWLGISKELFYNDNKIAILPMGMCFPGQSPTGGDLRPRRECVKLWREKVINLLPKIEVTLLVGQYAIDWHLGSAKKKNLTETVKCWHEYAPHHIPLPHPSPRNNIWLHKNPWFEQNVIPEIRQSIRQYFK